MLEISPYQFFFGVVDAPESPLLIAAEAGWKICPVAQFVQRGDVVTAGRVEVVALRQVDAVRHRPVERLPPS